jgi:hypothetical protein
MKALIAIVSCFIFVSSCWAITPIVADATLRTEIKEYDKPGIGKIKIETTYRGKEIIMEVIKFPKNATRSYCFHGESILSETDEDNDGFFETIDLIGDRDDDFERFTRKKDGTVEPLSKEKYLQLKQDIVEKHEYLKQLYDDAEKN